MTEGKQNDEEIIFGGALDLGSKTKKTKEYIGIALKYCNTLEKSLITRLVGFKKTVRKTGLALIQVLRQTTDEFNDCIKKCKNLLGPLFPVKLQNLPLLHLHNMESLGVDGALITDKQMINMRILEYNPRCIVIWCGAHRCALVSKDVLDESRHEMVHTVCMKFFDLVNASPRFDDLFKKSQIHTQEASQFKANKPVALCDRPMHRWESTLKFYLKLEKVLLSVENFLAEIDEQGMAKDPKRTHIFPHHYIKRKITTDEFLITMAVDIDVLKILVNFTKMTEFIDHDVSLFLEQIDDVALDLKNMIKYPGAHFTEMSERLLTGDLKSWHTNEEHDEEFYRAWGRETIEAYISSWEDRFPDGMQEQLLMFRLFSMRDFRNNVGSDEEADNYGEDYEKEIAAVYCNPADFTAQYPEAEGETFSVPSLGSERDLHNQLLKFKRYIFRNCMGRNRETGQEWTTREVLLKVLSNEDPTISTWLDDPLRHILMIVLVTVTTSTDIERVFSVYTLYDNKLNQAAEPAHVEKMLTIMKESPNWSHFDGKAALVMWRKQKKIRRIQLPPIEAKCLQKANGKMWVKSIQMIQAKSKERRMKFLQRLQQSSEIQDELDHTETVETDEEEFENEDGPDEDGPDDDGPDDDGPDEDGPDDEMKPTEDVEEDTSETDNLSKLKDATEEAREESKVVDNQTRSRIAHTSIGDFFKPQREEQPNWKKHTQLLKHLHNTLQIGGENALTTCRIVLQDLKNDIIFINMSNQEYDQLSNCTEDRIGTSLIPTTNFPDTSKALKSSPNGNCFFNAISIMKLGNEDGAALLRIMTAAGMTSHSNLCKGFLELCRKINLL